MGVLVPFPGRTWCFTPVGFQNPPPAQDNHPWNDQRKSLSHREAWAPGTGARTARTLDPGNGPQSQRCWVNASRMHLSVKGENLWFPVAHTTVCLHIREGKAENSGLDGETRTEGPGNHPGEVNPPTIGGEGGRGLGATLGRYIPQLQAHEPPLRGFERGPQSLPASLHYQGCPSC